jgi:hypothetical protein
MAVKTEFKPRSSLQSFRGNIQGQSMDISQESPLNGVVKDGNENFNMVTQFYKMTKKKVLSCAGKIKDLYHVHY